MTLLSHTGCRKHAPVTHGWQEACSCYTRVAGSMLLSHTGCRKLIADMVTEAVAVNALPAAAVSAFELDWAPGAAAPVLAAQVRSTEALVLTWLSCGATESAVERAPSEPLTPLSTRAKSSTYYTYHTCAGGTAAWRRRQYNARRDHLLRLHLRRSVCLQCSLHAPLLRVCLSASSLRSPLPRLYRILHAKCEHPHAPLMHPLA